MRIYGEYCIFKVKELREKYAIICLERYGKTSIQIMREALSKFRKDTSIEKEIEKILLRNNIEYKKQYSIFYKKDRSKTYDFYLPTYNVLIEADGDYWHGNRDKFKTLNETQLKNLENDIFKNKLAIDYNHNLIRFWGSEIIKKNFENVFMKTINNE